MKGPVNFVALPNYLSYDNSLINHRLISLTETDESISKVDMIELTITNSNAKQYKFYICSVNLWMDNIDNVKYRESQVDKLLYEVSRFFPNPVILCGTFIDQPNSDTIKKLGIFSNVNRDNHNTYFVGGKKKCSDYIFIYNTIINVFYIPPGLEFAKSLSILHTPLLCNLYIPSILDIQLHQQPQQSHLQSQPQLQQQQRLPQYIQTQPPTQLQPPPQQQYMQIQPQQQSQSQLQSQLQSQPQPQQPLLQLPQYIQTQPQPQSQPQLQLQPLLQPQLLSQPQQPIHPLQTSIPTNTFPQQHQYYIQQNPLQSYQPPPPPQ